jgi:hypothetical protein
MRMGSHVPFANGLAFEHVGNDRADVLSIQNLVQVQPALIPIDGVLLRIGEPANMRHMTGKAVENAHALQDT